MIPLRDGRMLATRALTLDLLVQIKDLLMNPIVDALTDGGTVTQDPRIILIKVVQALKTDDIIQLCKILTECEDDDYLRKNLTLASVLAMFRAIAEEAGLLNLTDTLGGDLGRGSLG